MAADSAHATLEHLYRTYGHVVVRRGRRLLGSEQEGQELLHDVFSSLLTRGTELDKIEQPAGWLYAVATRRALTKLRDRQARSRKLADELAPMLDGDTTTLAAGRNIEIAQLMRDVPDDELAAIIFFYLDELTHDEIAVQLECSRRHVGNLLTRGRTALRAAAGTPLENPL